MGAVDYSLALEGLVELKGDLFFCVSIKVTSCFIEVENFSIFLQQASSNQQALSLSSGELATEVTYVRLVLVWHFQDFVVNLTLFGDVNNFINSSVRVTVL